MPSEFQSKKPPSPTEFQGAARGIGMDIFWDHPFGGVWSSITESELLQS